MADMEQLMENQPPEREKDYTKGRIVFVKHLEKIAKTKGVKKNNQKLLPLPLLTPH